MISQKQLVLKMKEKLCEERCFGVLKALKIKELLGLCPLNPCWGVALGPHQGALKRAPGPHAIETLHSLCSLRSTWTQTIFIQHPRITNPTHAHDVYGFLIEWNGGAF